MMPRRSLTSLTSRAARAAAVTLTALGVTAIPAFAADPAPGGAPLPAAARFHAEIKPLLTKYCYDCHGDGMSKGKVSFDTFASDADLLSQPTLWASALKNVRAGLMPPDDGPRPSAVEIAQLERWIKYDALAIDPANPDPGRVVVRRLNRVEYRNSIRDLMGIEFDTAAEFPPDDTGEGFDNNGEVLNVSPLLLEKYLQAAESIVDLAVPKVARIPPTRIIAGHEFRAAPGDSKSPIRLEASEARTVSLTLTIERTETYRIATDFEIKGSYEFHPGDFTAIFRLDGVEQFRERSTWLESKPLRHEREQRLAAGDHVLTVEVIPHPLAASAAVLALPGPPATPAPPVASPETPAAPARPVRRPPSTHLSLRVHGVKLIGPLDPVGWIAPENHARFFPQGPAPADPAARARYASELLRDFATRAFRRPVEEAKISQLVAVARAHYEQPGQTFETGVARAMMAVLASPRFLFRMEPLPPGAPATGVSPLDEYALASRLSYFLWASTPDEELYRLAARGELRQNLAAQVARLLKSPRSAALSQNFSGQWLQARDVETVPINARAVLGNTVSRETMRQILPVRGEFDIFLRESMRKETEACFDYILRENRSVLELIDADYAFLNARLAKIYGLPDVSGEALQRVSLPPGSARGGVLTSGTVLTLTSNPTRTSPVKRGLFILDNILGVPPPPPPPDIPALEETKRAHDGRSMSLREILAEHRESPACSSCHQRMDPLGLALENFTALGTWRDQEADQPISPAGRLATGEAFTDVRELKRLLTTGRRLDYYRCLTEKLLTYALGRGIAPADLHTVDVLVAQLDAAQGRFSVLLEGIIASPAFQNQRNARGAPPAAVLTQATTHP